MQWLWKMLKKDKLVTLSCRGIIGIDRDILGRSFQSIIIRLRPCSDTHIHHIQCIISSRCK